MTSLVKMFADVRAFLGIGVILQHAVSRRSGLPANDHVAKVTMSPRLSSKQSFQNHLKKSLPRKADALYSLISVISQLCTVPNITWFAGLSSERFCGDPKSVAVIRKGVAVNRPVI